jgi:cytochrome c peroxidase
MKSRVLGVGFLAAIILTALSFRPGRVQADKPLAAHTLPAKDEASYDWQLPNPRWQQQAFRHERHIYFVNRADMSAEWDRLPAFWNEVKEKVADPMTGAAVERLAVKIKVPLGLQHNPSVPAENPMTVAKWELGKKLYSDPIVSSNGTVSCASCHDPRRGYTDQAAVSTGIKGLKGGISAPTVLNTAYSPLLFWDGRALSLEDQAQGPPQNPMEMFDGEGNAWQKVVQRVRLQPDYVQRFQAAFGTEPTRDAIAKAIACYERTVLSGNSIHDRADLARQKRGGTVLGAQDYEAALGDAVAKKDVSALEALGIDSTRDGDKLGEWASRLDHGRSLFFGKARCNQCHTGDNFTDNQFHNLGVGVKGGVMALDGQGRFTRLPTGHKNPELMGAFKTPTLRGLLGTAPYMHDGSEPTLESVIDFYHKGGSANEFLDARMRDLDREKTFEVSRIQKTPFEDPDPKVFGKDQRPIIPRRLGLTGKEKQDLVLFLKALQGDPVDPIVADAQKLLSSAATQDQNTEREQIIAKIEKLGGKVEVDDKSPGKPVITVNLHGTKVTDDDLKHFKALPQLQKLNLGWTQIGDAGLEHLKDLTKLQRLVLDNTKVTDAGVKHLKGLTDLEYLNL